MPTPTTHNPTNFEPRDYEVLDYIDRDEPDFSGCWGGEQAPSVEHLRCAHCHKTNIRWVTVVLHIPTGERLWFGADCTKRLGFADKLQFKLAQLKAKAETRKVNFAVFNKRVAFLTENPAIADALAHIDEPQHAKNFFAKDVLSKLDKYGYLTDPQTAAVVTSLQRDREFAARRAAEDTEAKGPAPTGRVQVTGTVLSRKVQESDFGLTTKLLIKLENNSKVWVTAPSGEGERGDTITLKATWAVSNTDASFAYGSRPHLVNLTPAATEAAAA